MTWRGQLLDLTPDQQDLELSQMFHGRLPGGGSLTAPPAGPHQTGAFLDDATLLVSAQTSSDEDANESANESISLPSSVASSDCESARQELPEGAWTDEQVPSSVDTSSCTDDTKVPTSDESDSTLDGPSLKRRKGPVFAQRRPRGQNPGCPRRGAQSLTFLGLPVCQRLMKPDRDYPGFTCEP